MKIISSLLFLAALFMQGCVSFPEDTSSGQGRLLINSHLEATGGSSGPWSDYQLWARHMETGDVELFRIEVERNMRMSLSAEMNPGVYEITEWFSYDKQDYSRVKTPVKGQFEIKADSITFFDHELVVTLTPTDQRADFVQRDEAFKDQRFQELALKYPNLGQWDIYWIQNPPVEFDQKGRTFKPKLEFDETGSKIKLSY